METSYPDYDLELERVIDEISRRQSRVVVFQMPDGLKRYIPHIRRKVEAETSAFPVFSIDPCFGACDIPCSLSELGADIIVHMGHAKMTDLPGIPVIYVPCFSGVSGKETLRRKVKRITESRIGILANVQHVQEIPEISRTLEENGHQVRVAPQGTRTQYPGQILGCNFHAARSLEGEVDAFLYVGGGDFHPLGAALSTGKKVYVLDPFSNELRDAQEMTERALRKRFAQIEKARGARRFGIIVSTKPGQNRLEEALSCLGKLEKDGYEGTVFCSDHLDPERLRITKCDAYVNFGCPRMSLEDSVLFPKPVITPIELEILLGERKWEEYALDEIT